MGGGGGGGVKKEFSKITGKITGLNTGHTSPAHIQPSSSPQSCSHRGLAQEAMFVYTVGNPTQEQGTLSKTRQLGLSRNGKD